LAIADFQLPICSANDQQSRIVKVIANRQLAIANLTSSLYDLCACGNGGRTFETPADPAWSSCSWL
jgi:hypothetical protein